MENVYIALRAALMGSQTISDLAGERIYASHGTPPAEDPLAACVVLGVVSDSTSETGLHVIRFQVDYYAPASSLWDAWAMAEAGAGVLHSKTLAISGWTCFWIELVSRHVHEIDDQGVARVQDDYYVKLLRPVGD